MVTLPPWLVGLVLVYVIALTAIFGYLFMEQVQRKRRRREPPVDHDAEILAVAQEGLEAVPELADDAEATARTCLALEEVAELRRLARADGAEAAFVTPGTPRLDAFLAELFPRTKDAPKEKP